MTSHNVYRDGKVYVCAEKCSTCIFRPGNLMKLQAGRVKQMVQDTRGDEGSTIPCHQTLEGWGYPESGNNAICRGWYDAYADESALLQMAQRLGIIKEQ